jgi:hypothetical protein
MIGVTQQHNEYRLAGTLAHLDSGTGPARLQVYEGTRPGAAGGTPAGSLLVEITLTQPAGVVAAGQLALTQAEDGLIATSGTATWGRFVNGDGQACFDADVNDGINNGEIEMASRQLYAGGDAKMLSVVLG